MDPEGRFAALVETFVGNPGVTGPGEPGRRGFGSSALKVNGCIFAMLTRGQLVVKLPRDRVDRLIGSGTGAAFDAGKGRPMQEWVTVVADDEETWEAVAREALAFVGSRRR
ncbi:MAG: TfoX/Sxy family protein [Actinomycetota bacterium]|nr:TfoX/Sxy family protein [Actinomycetota bacterium]